MRAERPSASRAAAVTCQAPGIGQDQFGCPAARTVRGEAQGSVGAGMGRALQPPLRRLGRDRRPGCIPQAQMQRMAARHRREG